MMFVEEKKLSPLATRQWRYYGRVKDEKGNKWSVYSNDCQQIKELKKKKKVFGMTLVGNLSENKNFRITRMLKEIDI